MGSDHRLAGILLAVSAGYLGRGLSWIPSRKGNTRQSVAGVPSGDRHRAPACAAWIGLRRRGRGDSAAPDADTAGGTERQDSEDRRRADPAGSAGSGGRTDPDQQGRPAWRAAAPAAAAFLAYIALLAPVGYLLATTVFIPVEARLLGSRSWRRDLIAGLVITAAIHAVLGLLLGFRLPAGVFG